MPPAFCVSVFARRPSFPRSPSHGLALNFLTSASKHPLCSWCIDGSPPCPSSSSACSVLLDNHQPPACCVTCFVPACLLHHLQSRSIDLSPFICETPTCSSSWSRARERESTCARLPVAVTPSLGEAMWVKDVEPCSDSIVWSSRPEALLLTAAEEARDLIHRDETLGDRHRLSDLGLGHLRRLGGP